MRSNPLLRTFFAALVVVAAAVVASAQSTQVNGKVTMKQADGTVVPVVGAQIDIYRTDIKAEFHTKTDKKGNYIHAGLPFVGTYTVIVSAPGASPTFTTKQRFTQETRRDFELVPGDGSRPSIEDVAKREATGGGGGAPAGGGTPRGESKEEKAKREEMERKIKEIENENKKIEEGNAAITNALKAGNDAFNAKKYDEAVTAYSQGIASREEPVLYSNRSLALRMRAIERYNANINSQDATAKAAAMEASNKDWLDAAESAKKSMDLINAAPVPTDPTEKNKYDLNKQNAAAAYAEAMKFVGTKVDKTRAEEAFKIYSDFAATEPDQAKKVQRMSQAAKILFDANLFDRAAAEYQKVLALDPENAEANLYLGFALFNSGDKAKFQEAANYLGKFSEKALDNDPFKADAKSILEFLKTQENIKPEKLTPARPPRRGGRP
jgi:tetratricopeptide (TPR) repeat protein